VSLALLTLSRARFSIILPQQITDEVNTKVVVSLKYTWLELFVNIEIIDIKELAKRLGLEVRFIKKAIKLGQLEPGVHFIDICGGGPIFEWNAELIKKLHESCRKQPEARTQKARTTTDQSKINLGSLGLAHLDTSMLAPSKPTPPRPT
jgi:hypothetical protein